MDPERLRKIEELYEAALEVEPARRATFLAENCAGDEAVRREVESLLLHDDQTGSFLKGPTSQMIPDAPRLAVGQRISHYEIQEELGEGGMGVVYKARDTRLNRVVALKFVKAQFSERFEREARAIAALNHPHIATLYEVGEHQGAPYLAMEFIDGKPLKGRRPLKEVIEYGIQTADALAAAHAAGVVHRDLKPANILVTAKGSVKILDFGLAKLRETGDGGHVSTTLTGVSAGTPGYMSPEQIDGKRVDSRSDIFAFGCVLYELVSGRRAFEGDSISGVLAATASQEPKLLDGVPEELERLIRRCLRKDPDRRLQHIGDAKIALEELKEQPDFPKPVAPILGRRRRLRYWLLIPALALLVTAAAGVNWWLRRYTKPALAPVLSRLTSDYGLTTEPALSPDGKLLAYASDRSGEGNLDIYVRQVGGGDPVRLTWDPADDREPAFSPDGTRIAFRSEREGGAIYLVSALGGPARRIAPEGRRPQFSPDGNWIAYWAGVPNLLAGSSKAYVIASAGGVARQVQPGFSAACWPVWMPDGRHLLFLGSRDVMAPLEERVDWWVTPLDSGTALRTGALETTRNRKLAGPLWVNPWALVAPSCEPRGHSLVFSARSGDSVNLWRIAISPETFKVAGLPQRLTSGTTSDEYPSVALGPGGSIRVAFASLTDNVDIWSLPVKANEGKVTGEPQRLTQDAAADFYPGLSADDGRMVFISDRTGHQEIWIKDLRTGEESALTASLSNKFRPHFSTDGFKVSFSSEDTVGKWNIYAVPTTGGAPEILCEDCGQLTSWSSDGKHALGNSVDGRVWLLDPASRRRTTLLARTGSHLAAARFSPDGRWISFVESREASRSTYIVSFQGEGPIGESAWIPIASGGQGHWSPDGGLIYFYSSRDGFACVWAQRLDPVTKHPSGAPFAVFHSHGSRRSLGNLSEIVLCVGRDKILFSMGERTGNIWMMELPEKLR